MKRGTGGRVLSARGYTIIETMIFLVVTGALLVSVLGFLAGAQSRTRFSQGLREMDANLRGAMNDVESGFFDDRGGFVCTAGPGTLTISPGANEQGKNDNCVFMGKVVQFGPNNGGGCAGNAESECSDYAVHTVVGRRTVASGSPPTGLQQATLTPVFNSLQSSSSPDLSEYKFIPGGLRVNKIYEVRGGASTDMASVGFLYSLGTSGVTQGNSSGVTNVSVGASTLGDNKEETFDSIRGLTEANRNPDQIVICFDEGGNIARSRVGAIVIGGKGRELTTEVIVDARANPPVGEGCNVT